MLSAESSVEELESRILAISVPREVSWVLISSARPTKLRATSALTPSRVRSTSLAFCLSTLLTPLDTAPSTRSTSPALCLMVPLALVEAAISDRSSSAALCFSVEVMPVLSVATERSVALRMPPTTRSASVEALPMTCTASVEFCLMVSANEVMRPSRASATDLVRELMCSLMASMRPTQRVSKRPITWPTERSVSPDRLVMVRSAALVTWVKVRSAARAGVVQRLRGVGRVGLQRGGRGSRCAVPSAR